MSRSNLKNCRQLQLVWPDLDPHRTAFAVLGPIRQTASGEFEERVLDAPVAARVMIASTALSTK